MKRLLLPVILLCLMSIPVLEDPSPRISVYYWMDENVAKISFSDFPWPLSSILPRELTFNLSGGNKTFYVSLPVIGRVEVKVVVYEP